MILRMTVEVVEVLLELTRCAVVRLSDLEFNSYQLL